MKENSAEDPERRCSWADSTREVYHLDEGQDCTSWLNNNKGDLGKMFLSHLENVVGFLQTEFPEKKLLMWDDMLRKLSRESIQGSLKGSGRSKLLPVGIPSLVVCLKTLKYGELNEDAKKDISHILGFSSINPEKNTCDGTGGFPGSEIYNMVKKVHSELKGKVHEITEGESEINGWFSRYHRAHRFGNPHKMGTFSAKILK
ncbi:hexosaminidase D-like [Eleutherodactylus coqui]|uniref:hexosaminidase D-like n=1 Tax=Eleutherodactylus coqui TaxID=57060 RepID=UPI003461D5A9